MRRIVALVGMLAAFLAIAYGAAADQSYTDPTGDGKVGTDIANTTVRNDAAGNISIRVASANPIVANHALAIFIDADRNPGTGSSTGDEYWMYGGPATGTGFFAWNGSQFAAASPADFVVGAAASNVTEFRFNKADIGNTSAFNFVVISISLDPPNVNFWDFAPDTGWYTYTLATGTTTTTTTTSAPPPSPTVTLGAPVARAGIHAGKAFSISAPVSTNARSVRITCTARVGGLTLHPRGSHVGVRAVCAEVAPAGRIGKRLTGTISATIAGGRARRSFSFVVRR